MRSSSSEAFDQKLRSAGDAGKGVSCFGWEGGRDGFESPLGGCISRLMPFPKTDVGYFGASCALRMKFRDGACTPHKVQELWVTVCRETPTGREISVKFHHASNLLA